MLPLLQRCLTAVRPGQIYRQYSAICLEASKIPAYLLDRTTSPSHILSNLAPEDCQRLAVIQSEYSLYKEQGAKVPSSLSDADLVELLSCPSQLGREKCHLFLFKKEMKRLNRQEKKVLKSPHIVEQFHESGMQKDAGIIRIIDEHSIRRHWESYIYNELRCPNEAQSLIFDFSYASEMRLQDQRLLSRQMRYVLNQNRLMAASRNTLPFRLVLAGLQQDTNQWVFFEKYLDVKPQNPNVKRLTDLPWLITPDHYSTFLSSPQDRIVYLSPNANRTFETGEWDHNATYIIGALVDTANQRPISFAKARRAGIDCVRLPLERYFKWSSGSNKALTLNQMHAILATAKSTNGDWEKALRDHLPRRKIADPESMNLKRRRNIDKLLDDF